MVESKIRVEVTEFSNVDNPFYGNTIVKKVIEENLIHDTDKRKFLAPCGVVATFSIDKGYEDSEGKKIDAKEVFDIKVNRHFFDEVLPNAYFALFHVDERIFELFVHFDGKQITNITLSEWLNYGDFEDGDDADNIYGAKNGLVNCDILE